MAIEVVENYDCWAEYMQAALLSMVRRVEAHGRYIVTRVAVGRALGAEMGAPCTLDGGIEVVVDRGADDYACSLVTEKIDALA